VNSDELVHRGSCGSNRSTHSDSAIFIETVIEVAHSGHGLLINEIALAACGMVCFENPDVRGNRQSNLAACRMCEVIGSSTCRNLSPVPNNVEGKGPQLETNAKSKADKGISDESGRPRLGSELQTVMPISQVWVFSGSRMRKIRLSGSMSAKWETESSQPG
jgi:hypothetical protein